MQGISTGNFHALAETFDFAKYQTVCDVGGANGQLCIVLANHHAHLRCTTLDLSGVTEIAEKTVSAAGLADRITCATGGLLDRSTTEGRRHHHGHGPS
jgi:tRNA1(Val) A37 N6-methylase TrmN6